MRKVAEKTQYFVRSSSNSTLHSISGVSSDLPKLLRYFNGTAIVAFLKIPSAPFSAVCHNNLALYLKYLKIS